MSEFASTYDVLAPRDDRWVRGVVPDVRAAWACRIEPSVAPGARVVDSDAAPGRRPVLSWRPGTSTSESTRRPACWPKPAAMSPTGSS
jgi:hypothetical protein